MLWKTHLAFGFLAGLALMPFFNKTHFLIYFGLVLFGALLPDIDNPESKVGRHAKVVGKIFRHRGVIHTLWLAAIICGVIWYFIGSPFGIALLIGYVSHLFIDGFTKQGTNFLHPIAKLHLSGFIETGKLGEFVVFFLCIVGCAIFLLKYIPYI
jgi:inner membrane protein